MLYKNLTQILHRYFFLILDLTLAIYFLPGSMLEDNGANNLQLVNGRHDMMLWMAVRGVQLADVVALIFLHVFMRTIRIKL